MRINTKWRVILVSSSGTIMALLTFWLMESVLQEKAQPFNPLAVLIAIGFSMTITSLYAGKLSRQLEVLYFTIQRLGNGNFERTTLIPDSHDELGEFAAEINKLSRQIEDIITKARQEAYKMETILTSMEEGVLSLDHTGKIVLINAAAEKMFGRKRDEVVSKYLIELIRNSELDQIVTNILTQEAEAGSTELGYGQRIFWVHFSPIIGESGRIRGVVIVFHDLTELRRLEQVRTEFVSNVSHELRTPLTSIKGFVETLMDGAMEDAELNKRFLGIIQSETLRLQRLIDDLLTLARIENWEQRRGEPKVSFAQTAFLKIHPVIAPYADAKGLSLEINLPDDLPGVRMGEDLLSQVLLNLMENAIKYTTKGHVWLKASAGDQYLNLEIGDTGCGIPQASLPRIFERFYRVDKARSREQGGTGLGLSIVKHIIEGSGGTINVQSILGQGTVFHCELPRASL